MVEMLRTPSWVLGLATGVTLGLTHLTKASVLPGIALFALCFAAKQALWLVRSQAERQRSSRWHVAWVALALTLLAFLATIYPYIRDSKLRFGRYFYNVNSTF